MAAPPAHPGTDEQRRVVDLLLAKKCVLLCGAAGTGKTFAINAARDALEAAGLTVACLSPTGLAALNMRGGMTVARFVGAGRALRANDRDALQHRVASRLAPSRFSGRMRAAGALRDRLAGAHVLIVDEASMLRDFDLEMLEFALRRARNNTRPFGGAVLLASGDFRQLAPVGAGEAGEAPFLDGAYMGRFERVRLSKVFRQRDAPFLELLGRLAEGAPAAEDDEFMGAKAVDEPPSNAVALFATNASCDAFNARRMAALPGADDVYEAQWHAAPAAPAQAGKAPTRRFQPYTADVTKTVEGVDETAVRALEEAFGRPEAPGDAAWRVRVWNERRPLPARVMLRPGTPVMVRANVDVEGGVANGATGVYEGRDAATGQARVRLGARTLLIAPHVWEGEAEGYALAYRQTPLVPAWGLTIHKAQGQQFENVFVDFGDFARWPDASKLVGMAYVAVSRVTAPEGFSQRGYRRCFVVADAAANAFYARA